MSAPSITWVDEASSTNTLMALRCADLPHGAVIAARRQTAGRGQRGNSWESQPDSNLTFSMLLRPKLILAATQFQLSMLVSLGVCDALRAASELDIKVKWPNDIYVGDKKICGILIEN
ncbi:MAG: biotin--[acetyl-CoA-carboxylase] ligase, partial [Muribaculaceae bacterium]|nr:biotin--[acetyl-CoA-carboxylase] ligase [Muribaculaceae bacterium]